MPIHDLGYRNWEGERSHDALRWWVIAQTGVRITWQSAWVRRMLFFAWLPTLGWAIGFFFYEQALQQSPEALRFVVDMLETFDTNNEFGPLIAQMRTDPAAARHDVWSALLMTFFRSPQAILMVMLIGLIAPPLISRDVRSRAFLVYFSRPLMPWEYALGKACVVWAYLMMITCLPALALFMMAVLLSPELTLLQQTWDLPFRIVGATVVLLIPTTAVALCFSSLTSESRYAGFAWFSVWVFGWVAYGIVEAMMVVQSAPPFPDPNLPVNQQGPIAPGEQFRPPRRPGYPPPVTANQNSSRWHLLSPYATLGKVQAWVFGLRKNFSDVLLEAMAVLIVTALALAVLLRRVSAPMRI